jgi:hypothetical protein
MFELSSLEQSIQVDQFLFHLWLGFIMLIFIYLFIYLFIGTGAFELRTFTLSHNTSLIFVKGFT